MKVFADNSLVWEGSVGEDALRFDGPVGMRSVNARLQISFASGKLYRATIFTQLSRSGIRVSAS